MNIDRLTSAGYEHYEISNFAKPGFRSRHNSSYWDGTPYIGIGAAAHSYDIRSRSWNVADIKQYMEGIEKGNRIFEEELIDENTHYNDTVTVALRTQKGICLDDLSERHRDYCLKNARWIATHEWPSACTNKARTLRQRYDHERIGMGRLKRGQTRKTFYGKDIIGNQ